jgi:hypothetical protein
VVLAVELSGVGKRIDVRDPRDMPSWLPDFEAAEGASLPLCVVEGDGDSIAESASGFAGVAINGLEWEVCGRPSSDVDGRGTAGSVGRLGVICLLDADFGCESG